MSEERYDEEDYENEDVENSAEDEYPEDDDGSEEEAIDGADEAADDDMEHVEWGFEPKKRRFSKEVVLGLVAVTGLIAVFAFVVHNQFSGGAEDVASLGSDNGSGADAGSGETATESGTGGEPDTADDPFADSPAGPQDTLAPGSNSAALAQIGSDEPPLADHSSDLSENQFEPDPGAAGETGAAAGLYSAAGSDPFGTQEPAGSAGVGQNVASRETVFGDPVTGQTATGEASASGFGFESQAADPFGSNTAGTGQLSGPDPLVSQNNPAQTGGGLSADMLPDEGHLNGTSLAGTSASGADTSPVEPFGSEPALGGASALPGEQPHGLFDSHPAAGQPASGSLAGNEPDAFGTGLASDGDFAQPGSLNAPLPGGAEFSSEPAVTGMLPPSAGDGGLLSNDLPGLPTAGSGDPGASLPEPGRDGGLPDPAFSGGFSGETSLAGEPGAATQGRDPFGTESADGFQTPVVSNRNDVPGSGSPGGSPAFDSSGVDPFGGFDTAAGSATSVRSAAGTGTGAPHSGSYTVQENDSFWSISRKLYGTPKYFEALQKYNRSKVADPKKLRPGMVLDVPSPEVLADYSGDGTAAVSPQAVADGSHARSALPTAAARLPVTAETGLSETGLTGASPAGLSGGILPAESAGDAETVQTVASTPTQTRIGESQRAGFFIGNQGYPMYRVGAGDTLTAIAADHLGRASRWKQIYRMNRNALKSPNELAPGLILKLPGDASRVPLIDRTSSLR